MKVFEIIQFMSVENSSVSYMFQGIHLMYPSTIGYFPTNRRPFKEAIRATFLGKVDDLSHKLDWEELSSWLWRERGGGGGVAETSRQKARIAALMNKNVWSETLL